MNRPRTKSNRRIKNSKARRGAAMVEFAIIANIMFVAILTCMEFARLNMARNLAQDAAYFAARHAMVPGATKAEAVAEAERIMDSMVTTGYTVSVGDIDSETSDVSVSVSVDLDAISLFAPMFLPNANIETVAHMKTERYDGFYEQ